MSIDQILQRLARPQISDHEFNTLRVALDGITAWSELLNKAELYAIVPLMNEHFQHHSFAPPTQTQLSIKALVVRHRAAANARYALVQELSEHFKAANLPLVALKGLALAPMVYARDDLRPMRDIDVLVPKGRQLEAGELLREIGFDLPLDQPSKFMRDSHQLPNATKQVNGFTISVEIHHDALSRDVPGSLFYDQVERHLQAFSWRDLKLTTLGHEQMLHQVCRHLTGLHPGAILKLVNVLDAVLYAEKYHAEINWAELKRNYSHVLNTLRCLHYVVPLSDTLQSVIGGISDKKIGGVGETMQPLTTIMSAQAGRGEKLAMLMSPPDWWLHLYYNVHPAKSLIKTKLFSHPARIGFWLVKRLYSRLLGG